MAIEQVDVLIVGAGLSGVGAGHYVQTHCPQKSYLILEARDALGGTWDLFRYPGVRSDSDMYTLGFSFHPWNDPKAIADGPSILSYIHETAQAYGIDRKIRFRHRVQVAEWSSAEARWTIDAMGPSGEIVRFKCSFLYLCSGYYDYEQGYSPTWPGIEPIYAHWLRAILRAHRQLRKGLAIQCPVLVLHSSASVRGEIWHAGFQNADSVLNVEHIRQGSRYLGPKVTVCEVKDGVHDLFLSRADVRAQVFSDMFHWLDGLRM